MICLRFSHNLRVAASYNGSICWRRHKHKARRKNAKPNYRNQKILYGRSEYSEDADTSDSSTDVLAAALEAKYLELERELEPLEEEETEILTMPEDEIAPVDPVATSLIPEYRTPHRFVGFDPRRMDLEGFPRLRTDFDGKRSNLAWLGTECQRCGLQIRRERRTNREASLNVYAHAGIPDDLLRHCPEQKHYPVLWRTRDPYVALDILGVEDY